MMDMMDLKTLISKSAIDPELTRVRNSMRREDRETIPEEYRTAFDKLSIRWGLIFAEDQIVFPIDLRRRLLDILHFRHSGTTKIISEAKIFWWPGLKQDIENRVKDCTACLASGKNLKYQLPKKPLRKIRKIIRTRSRNTNRLEIQIGKLHNKNLHGETQIRIAVNRFSKWRTVKVCKTSEAKKVINFLTSNFNLYGIPKKFKSDRGGAFISKGYKKFGKERNIEIEILDRNRNRKAHLECIPATE